MNTQKPLNAWQQDLLKHFREQQEAYLEAVAAWQRERTAGAAPTPPSAPHMNLSATAAEAFESNRAFMEAAFKQQQDFLDKLTRTLST